MSFSVVSCHLFFLCASQSHVPSFSARPPSTFDSHRPQVASSRQRCSRLIYITQYSLQVVSASGKKNIPFQHFGDSSTWPQYLPPPPPTSHVTSPRAPRCCSKICAAQRGGTETSVALQINGWSGIGAARQRLPEVPSEVVFRQLPMRIALRQTWPGKISGWLRNRFMGQDTT